jgi:PBSX family phage terminase large subunit
MTSALLTVNYVPRGAALDVFSRRDDEVLMAGPAGTGKSRACLEKLHAMCIANPGMRALMLRKTHVSMTNTGLVTYREHVAHQDIAAGLVKWFGGSGSRPAAFMYNNGSTINVGGMDNPMKVMSSEYDVIYVQEATELKEEEWEALTTRLRNGRVSFQQILADCNPDTPFHWLKKRCDAGKTHMLYSKHEDNPTLYNVDGTLTVPGAKYMGKLDNLSGVRKERLRYGRWAAADGLIYDEWDPQIHLIETMPAGWESWTRFWSIDFGLTNPTVVQFWAEDNDGRGYMYREIYQTGTIVEDIVKQIRGIVYDRMGNWTEPMPREVITDHDAEDRATFERHMGIRTVGAKKGVSEGLQAVKERLRLQEDGRPRLYLLRDALVSRDNELVQAGKPTSTAEEIPGYVWEPPKLGRPPKEAPLKEDDHGCDAKRYYVAQRDLVGRPSVRVIGGRR